MSVEHLKIQSQEIFNNGLNLQLPKHTATKNPAEQNIKEQHEQNLTKLELQYSISGQ